MLFLILLVGVAFGAPNVLQNALQSPKAFVKLMADYDAEFGKKYEGAEAKMRMGLFRKTLRKVVQHNGVPADYEEGLNQFSDMTQEEKMSYTGMNMSMIPADLPELEEPLLSMPMAGSRDWTGYAVTKIKNQGKCGSCWVFSATGAIEGQYKILGKVLKSFSEQEGLACSARNGCKGGWMGNVYDYVKRVGRYAPMASAPYKGTEGSCSFSRYPNGLISQKVSGYRSVRGDASVSRAIYSNGPVSVGYTVVDSFFRYKTGVYNERSCTSGGGHAVTAVGYTSTYYKMKNSWGISFGEKGYFRIARGNVCGITNSGTFPTMSSTGRADNGRDESTDEKDDGGDDGGACPSGYKKCSDGRCVHEHWNC